MQTSVCNPHVHSVVDPVLRVHIALYSVHFLFICFRSADVTVVRVNTSAFFFTHNNCKLKYTLYGLVLVLRWCFFFNFHIISSLQSYGSGIYFWQDLALNLAPVLQKKAEWGSSTELILKLILWLIERLKNTSTGSTDDWIIFKTFNSFRLLLLHITVGFWACFP